jgi:hypothetical protein
MRKLSFPTFDAKNASFYQGRLGTNVEKAAEKEMRFLR